MRLHKPALLGLALTFVSTSVFGAHPYRSFEEVVRASRLAFIGTAFEKSTRLSPNGKMVFTDFHFKGIEIVHKDPAYKLARNDQITLGFAGGEKDGREVIVTGVPRPEIGERYFIFVEYEDPLVICPVSGAAQGVFRVVKDKETGKSYPLTFGKRAIRGFDEKGHPQVAGRLDSISRGRAIYKERSSPDLRFRVALKPAPGSPSPNARARVSSATHRETAAVEKLVTLAEFKARVKSLLTQEGGRDR